MGKQHSNPIATRSGILFLMIAISVAGQRNIQNRALFSTHSCLELEVEGLKLFTLEYSLSQRSIDRVWSSKDEQFFHSSAALIHIILTRLLHSR
jgi:hypothetical protein